MKKIRVLLYLLTLSSLLLFGCGEEETPEATAEAAVEEEMPEAPAEEPPAEAPEEEINDDLPPEEGMVRHPLTNEWVSEEVASQRPVAVMVPNDKSALPHYNLSNADILYECLVEGGITRLMAVFGNWTDLERVGNIRSARDYYIYWAFEWDAILLHAGGPYYIDEVIGRKDTQNINALTAPSGVYYRTTDRSAPQNMYFDGVDILKEVNRLDYPLTARDDKIDTVHFQFATRSTPNTLEQYPDSTVVKKIDLANAYPTTQTWFEYDPEDEVYYRFQKTSGGAHIDAANDTQLGFDNILIQFTYHEVRDDKGYLAFQCIDNTRDGWYFTKGRGIHVNWTKTSDYGPTKYYDDNGNEITLNTGKTMICIVQDGDTFAYEY